MQKLLELDIGKRKIRYWLSDEVLCLGSQLAPITSEFSNGLSFYEAYKQDNPPESASVYMSEDQVIWLVDELYSSLGAKNSKLTYEDVNIDTGRKLVLKEFKAIRRVSFKNNVARFRKRCGIPIITKAMTAESKIHQVEGKTSSKQNWKQASMARVEAAAAAAKISEEANPALGSPTSLLPSSTARVTENRTKPSSPQLADCPVAATPEAPKAFVTLTRAERQARLQAQREEMLRKHLEQQRLALPAQRRFYRNLERYGGAALACDVESWTEDAEVLLELGMAWFIWTPSSTRDGAIMERDGGSCHYSEFRPRHA